MLARQRQEQILELVLANGGARVSDLVEQLGVSDMTVRRDIAFLARRGLVARVHGGATAVGGRSTDEPGFAAKSAMQTEEKAAIAVAAASLVRPGDSVALSAGTTTYAVALELRGVPDLTVVTNSVPAGRRAARGRPARPHRHPHRWRANRRPTRWSGRSRSLRCGHCTSTGCSSACTAWTSAPG